MSNVKNLYTQLVVARLRSNAVVETENEFKIPIADKDFAVIKYTSLNGTYDLTHTEVPDTYKGFGLGSILAEKVFDHVINKKKKMKLTCEFLQHFYTKNQSKYKSHVVP